MTRRGVAIALLAALPAAGAAQGIGESSVISGPQYVSWQIGTGSGQKTVTQFSMPVAVIIPFSEAFNVDVSTSWALSRVASGGATASQISGLTDTQLRANLGVFDNSAVFTLGMNLATGMYRVPDAQQEAAGQIGSNFLLYPVSSMGSGNAITGGVAFARGMSDWNLGFGTSYRYSSPFDAYKVQNAILRFEPGNELRARLGADREVGDGRLSLGVTYSNFTDDKADSTTFATGARTLGQASLFMPTASGGDWTITAWDLYHQSGSQLNSVATPSENIANLNVAYGFNWRNVYVQPSLEGRSWVRDQQQAGTLFTGGVRLRFDWMGLSVNPALTYSHGNVYDTSTAESFNVNGFRTTVLVRYR